MSADTADTPGLSLKWRLLIPLTLVLAAGAVTLTWINDSNLRQQAGQSRLEDLRTHQALLGFLTQRLSRGLVDHGAAMVSLLPLQAAGDAELERLGQSQALDSLIFFDRRAIRQSGYGTAILPGALLQKRLREVLQSAAPHSGIRCDPRCGLYALVPVLQGGRIVGVLALGSDFSALLAGFAEGTGREVGVLAGSPPQLALATTPTLRAELTQVSFERGASLDSALAINQQGTLHSEWQRFKLTGTDDAISVVTRLDISAAAAARDRALIVNLATGAAVFLAVEILLWLTLGWLMRRMARVGRGLPLLGQGRWQEARTILKAEERVTRDEFGQLERAAVVLTGQLEALDRTNRAQRGDLDTLVQTLSRERDFTARVLDTAQALIVTQTLEGTLRMANHYAEALCGRAEGGLVGHDFCAVLIAASERSITRLRLAEHFVRGASSALHLESPFDSPDGPRNIAWVHSQIAEPGGERLILSVGVDLTELKLAQAQAHYLSEYDPLTGLYNRQTFQRQLAELLPCEGALVLIDLDNFKAINDLAGHEAGDAMIRQTAERLRSIDPPPRLTGRLGGDDFALFFDPLPDGQLVQIARHLCVGDHQRDIATACVGIAVADATAQTAEDLMAEADLALSRARVKGRANWHLFSRTEGIRETLAAQNEHLALISDALHEARLEVFLQPVIALQTGRTSHHECLLRVRMPDGSYLAPAPLIAAAEVSGLIREIDLWMLEHAAALIAQSQGRLKLAVNLSARSLDARMPPEIERIIALHGLNPQSLSFEITETAALAQLDHASSQLAAIRALGCKIALDDFGVGFSTFQYLKHLPVDYVKIDGSFIRMLDRNPDDQVFVRALVEAIHGYGKLAVAEYVETASILAWVQRLDVDFAQGYHFGRPLPATEVLRARAAV